MASTLTIPGYDITEVIHEGQNTIVLRGVSQQNQEKVILKALKAEYPRLEQISCLKYEYSITSNLNLEGVVKVLRLENHENRLVLVLEDFDGKSLKQFFADKQPTLVSFLSIAIQIAKSLVSLHSHQIIHKDIKPSNIIINPQTELCKITDFSIASRLDKETQPPIAANQPEGTLAYISPEQTGRMNRAVDYRSDFYSLGVTFYEILSGQLPFETNDSLELIHCHLAKRPKSLREFQIPCVIADIVMKLMAKNAEDRYQSAIGLLADLEFCLSELKKSGKICDFVPGQKDQAAQLLIPQKLYGRSEEIAALLSAFERVAGEDSKSEIILVSGYSGIGKSSLVNEVHKPIVRQRGYFIAGKFDQLNRNIPYASIIQAFKSLMQQLLTENTENLNKWKEKLLAKLGGNGQIIIDVIPEVELIIGKQPEVAQLGATESQNRFHLVFQQFIQVFCQKEHPLVLFLDDLQWIDSASLKLLEVLMTNLDSKYLLLIGAYRDNEVSFAHPLVKTLSEIEKVGTVINNIVLRPLQMNHVQQILVETFLETHLTASLQELAELLFNKTQGNPFFLTQLLKTLHQEKLLKFDFNKGCWCWNIRDIQSTGIADKTVVELIAANIEKLPTATQNILKLSACIGARFSLDVLATVSETELFEIAQDLQPALQQGLVLPLSNNYRIPLLFLEQELKNFDFDNLRVEYRFLHDRVQQAAYSFIPEDEKKEAHLKIGQLLLNKTPKSEIELHIFDIVNQLNVGIDTLIQQMEKDELARLNLIAGCRAKAATAYELAFKYFNTGLQLLHQDAWTKNYQLTLTLNEEAAEAAYINGNFEQMEELVASVLQQAKRLQEKVKIYEVKVQANAAVNKQLEAIEIILDALSELGITFSKADNNNSDIQLALTQTKSSLSNRQFSDLINLPLMVNENALVAIRLLSTLISSAFVAAPQLLPLIVCKQVNLSVEYGNNELSAFAYAIYGLILCGVDSEIEFGYYCAQIALKLAEKFNNKQIQAKTLHVVNTHILHWKNHIKDTCSSLQQACHLGIENGELEYATYAADIYCHHLYLVGSPLTEVEQQLSTYIKLSTKLKQNRIANLMKIRLQAVSSLTQYSQSLETPIEQLDNDLYKSNLIETNDRYALFNLFFSKLHHYYLFSDFVRAFENAKLAEIYLDGIIGMAMIPTFYFYDSLINLMLCTSETESKQIEIIDKVTENQNKLKFWAEFAPMNILHKLHLVEAEKYRVLGKNYEAMEYYDKAITSAAENFYLQEEALANELAALFYHSLGKQKIAKTYMTDAYYCYTRWGAIAKVNDLEKRYPNLIIRNLQNSQILEDKQKTITTTIRTSTATASTTTSSQILDLATVIKASEAIQSEINLEKLPSKLLHIIIENAGAQKGCLILEKENQLFIEAIDNYEESNNIIVQSILAEESLDIPVSIINYVARTQQTLLITDATIDPIYNQDSYIQQCQSKSILCIPIFYQTNFIGIFYLENNLTTGAFTPTRLELTKILSSQAAIAIKNARLLACEQQALSKLQNTQSQLIQTEKISALGQMVAGVAHEVNNPVSFISGNLSHCKQYVDDLINLVNLYQEIFPNPGNKITEKIETIDLEYLLEDLPKMLDSMKFGTDRIKDIMLSLRNYSRADGNEKKEVDIHEGIDSTLIILSHRLKAKPQRPAIKIIKEYGNLPLVKCFPGQLNQVFTNLISNAIDAMDEYNTGKSYAEIEQNINKITIQTSFYNQQVTISIADNGSGMPELVREKIFNAFFTTKAEGKGTGLGLSISREIITDKHQGKLECFSEMGKGTEFIISLPIQ